MTEVFNKSPYLSAFVICFVTYWVVHLISNMHTNSCRVKQTKDKSEK
jgi:hypothetical protein